MLRSRSSFLNLSLFSSSLSLYIWRIHLLLFAVQGRICTCLPRGSWKSSRVTEYWAGWDRAKHLVNWPSFTTVRVQHPSKVPINMAISFYVSLPFLFLLCVCVCCRCCCTFLIVLQIILFGTSVTYKNPLRPVNILRPINQTDPPVAIVSAWIRPVIAVDELRRIRLKLDYVANQAVSNAHLNDCPTDSNWNMNRLGLTQPSDE